MILDLVKQDDPVLKQECEFFDFQNPPVDPEKLARDLKETMVARRGIGLSANQVGLPYNVFVVGNPNEPENIVAFFNARIVDAAEENVLMEEGCLSYPGLFIKIKRPANCRIRYADEKGEVHTEMYDGIPARAILHEYDHMGGMTFDRRANRYHLDLAKRQKKKLDKIRLKNKNKLSN